MKRWFAKIVVFLLLGAIINLGVAWLCSVQSLESKLTAIEYRKVQAYGVPWSCIFLRRFGFDRILLESRMYGSPAADPSTLPTYIVVPPISDEELVDKHYVVAGWPRRSFYGVAVVTQQMGSDNIRNVEDPDYPITWQGAIAISDGSSDAIVRRVLPLRPLWTGLLTDTLFYAAILWFVAFGPFVVRRYLRNKQGRCIKCGYDLRGTSGGRGGGGCPECGWRREAAS